MNNLLWRTRPPLSRCLLRFGVFFAAASWLIATHRSWGATAHLEIDDSPLAREAKLAVSFAPVVKKVAPSVVSIFTTKKVANLRLEETFPFFDDPQFRRWFGEPPNESPGSRSRPQFRKERGLGSGVIVTRDGYILSNNHVVEGADEIKVALAEEKKEFTARVVGRDPQTDLALLKIEAGDLPALKLTDSDQIEVGDVVLALGNPFGVGQSVSHGIVSAVGRGGLGIETYENFIQTDAAINPGNSGGALVDAQGRLVGINTAIASRTGASAGVGFAVPVNLARGVIAKLLQGALVSEISPDSVAFEAGLRIGDVIQEINKRSIRSAEEAVEATRRVPSKRVLLRVWSQGGSRFLVVDEGKAK